MLVLAVLAVSYASSVRAWLNQRSEHDELRAQISEQRAAVAELEQTRRRWRDPAYIEAQARMRFSWVMPGEIGYRVIDGDGSVLSGGGALAEPVVERAAAEQPEWWEFAWDSVVAAGSEPPAESTKRRVEPKRTPLERIGGTQRQSGGDRPGPRQEALPQQ